MHQFFVDFGNLWSRKGNPLGTLETLEDMNKYRKVADSLPNRSTQLTPLNWPFFISLGTFHVGFYFFSNNLGRYFKKYYNIKNYKYKKWPI